MMRVFSAQCSDHNDSMAPEKSTKRTILEDLEAFEGANPSLVHVSSQGLWLDIPIHHFRRREPPVINDLSER